MRELLDKLSPRFKHKVQTVVHRFGVDVRIDGPRHRPDLRLVHFMKMHGIDLVMDVGANRGQFAKEIISAGYSGRIVSFEPLPAAHRELVEAAKVYSGRWQVATPVALSDEAGFADFQVTTSDTSSSLLEPTSDFTSALPEVQVASRLKVATERLDVAGAPYVASSKAPFLKVDVQGAELRVLRGGGALLSQLRGVAIEVCTDRLYDNQARVTDIIGIVEESGFDIWDINTAYRNLVTHRLGAIDIVCFRHGMKP